MNNQGSSTVIALFILVLLTTLASGLIMILNKNLLFEGQIKKRYEIENDLNIEAKEILKLFVASDTPEGDSIFDEVFKYSGNANITIEDLSSKINLNYIPQSLFTSSNLGNLFLQGKTAQEITEKIENEGLSNNFEIDFEDFFKDDYLELFFTHHTFANINSAYKYGLKQLYGIRTEKESMANNFIQKRDNKIQSKSLIKTTDLKLFLGIDFDSLYPLINAEPLLNVNLINEELLKLLLSYTKFDLKNKQDLILNSIIDSRQNHELTTTDLIGIINKPDNNLIYQYLGTKTWFWNVLLEKNNIKLNLIICKLPPISYGDKDIYKILEKRFSE